MYSSPSKRKREGTITERSSKYFEKIGTTNNSEKNTVKTKKTHVCKLCNNELNGIREWNLSSHLLNCHYDVYLEITSDKIEPIPIKRLKLMQNCTEIVTINGRPFSYLHDSGFKSIIKDTLTELRDGKHPLNLSDSNLTEIKNHLSETAEKIRNHIKRETEKRPLSLMCDIVTKHHRSILGVSLQYSVNGQRKVRSIGMIELHDSHTGAYLAEVIVKRLHELDINLKQIITITTDNGSNILKMVRDMACHLRAEINQSNQDEHENQSTSVQNTMPMPLNPNNNETEVDAAIDDLLSGTPDIFDDDDAAIQQIIDEVDNQIAVDSHVSLLNDVANEMINCGTNIEWDITSVNCAAHTLQLGIKDAMKKLGRIHRNIILLCKEACIFLRLKSTITECEKAGIYYRLPRLENATRWGSMYLMLLDLYQLESVVKYYANEKKDKLFALLERKWLTLKEIVYVLQIPYNVTVAFQLQELTLSDVYGKWISMQIHLQKCSAKSSFKTGLAGHLHDAMVKRNENIFSNPLMACAIYLDPRYRLVLNQCPEKAEEAKTNLVKIWNRLHAISEDDMDRTEEKDASTDSFTVEFDEEKELSQHLFGASTTTQTRPTTIDIEIELDLFQPAPIPIKSSIMEYWETAKEEYKPLYELALVIFSIPPTEVQVERDFSHLEFMFTNRRTSLKESRLEDIFLIHLNKDLFFKVNSEDLDEMFKNLQKK